MEITIEKLQNILELDDKNEQNNELVSIALESIALLEDNEILKNLMLKTIKANSDLNVQLKIQLESIKELSMTDQLTGLFNRRKLLEELKIEINRFVRYKHSFSLIMFDIDHFKKVNDTYGHDVGDFVLTKLAELVKDEIRKSDTFSRWGGEEFMILMPESTSIEAKMLAEKIRESIELYDFVSASRITCSFGVKTCDSDELCDIGRLTKHVDEALYRAKDEGRNKVILV